MRLSRSTIAAATTKLVDFIVTEFEPHYLRPPNDEELSRILKRNEEQGMPGCMGSIECSHWRWRQCPRGLAGQYHDRKGRLSVVMETLCDEDLYIWHFFIGSPGSQSDLNVWSQSPLYTNIMSRRWPPDRFPFTVNGRTRRVPCYLADGIYPKYPIFARPFAKPTDAAQRTYNRPQKALRKELERLYAVLTNRFNISLYPARFSNVQRIINTGKAIAIHRNMVMIHRRDGFISRRRQAAAAGLAQFDSRAMRNDTGRSREVASSDDRATVSRVAGGDRGPPAAASGGAGGVGDPPAAACACRVLGGGSDPPAAGSGAVGGGGGRPALTSTPSARRLSPIPDHGASQPDVKPGSAPPEAWFLRSLLARAAATSPSGHQTLCMDLAAHVWKHRRRALAPYL